MRNKSGREKEIALTIRSLFNWSNDELLALRRAVECESLRRDLTRDPDRLFWLKYRAMRNEAVRRQTILRLATPPAGMPVAALGTLACEDSLMS